MSHFSPDPDFRMSGGDVRKDRHWFRLGALVLGALLAVQALWILVPELLRPALPFFPATPAEARAVSGDRAMAALAAGVGWPRGDLWTDKSLTANASLVSAFEAGRPSSAPASDRDRATAWTAAKLAPTDARAWVLLAMTSAQAHDSIAAAQLKMSFYTAPYNAQLFPLRVQIAAQLPQINDEELQGLLQYEIQTIIHDKPSLKQFIALAFRAATPAARQFFEATLAQVDAALLKQLQSANP